MANSRLRSCEVGGVLLAPWPGMSIATRWYSLGKFCNTRHSQVTTGVLSRVRCQCDQRVVTHISCHQVVIHGQGLQTQDICKLPQVWCHVCTVTDVLSLKSTATRWYSLDKFCNSRHRWITKGVVLCVYCQRYVVTHVHCQQVVLFGQVL